MFMLAAIVSSILVSGPIPTGPWGNSTGPEPCRSAPEDASLWCKTQFGLECKRYRDQWHKCVEAGGSDEVVAACKAGAWSNYQSRLRTMPCNNVRGEIVASMFDGVLPEASLQLIRDVRTGKKL